MAQNGDKLAFLYAKIHLIDGPGGADDISFFISFFIFKYELFCLDHIMFHISFSISMGKILMIFPLK